MRLKFALFVVAMMAVFYFPKITSTQGFVDHWATLEECVAANTAPYYVATKLQNIALESGQTLSGLPQDSCVELDVPDRIALSQDGFAWVKQTAGEPYVFSAEGTPVRRGDCRNRARRIVPIPSASASDSVTSPSSLAVNGKVEVEHRHHVDLLEVKVSGNLTDEANEKTVAPSGKPSWFSFKRNGKWFWPLLVAGGVGGGLCAKYCRQTVVVRSTSTSTVTVNLR